MTRLALDAGGRHYFAKDSMLTKADVQEYLGKTTLDKFAGLKAKLDPDHILQTDLSRRLFDSFR
jgi:FAD/FMN-containing dehydrogenase